MEDSVEGCESSFSTDFTAANSEFHRIILESATSPRLSAMSAFVIELPLTQRTLERYSRKDLDRSMGHHRELIDALEARDGAWAASVMKSHIFAAYQALAGTQSIKPAATRQRGEG
jgi:DNA-binding GntR family transcriptional regulator